MHICQNCTKTGGIVGSDFSPSNALCPQNIAVPGLCKLFEYRVSLEHMNLASEHLSLWLGGALSRVEDNAHHYTLFHLIIMYRSESYKSKFFAQDHSWDKHAGTSAQE